MSLTRFMFPGLVLGLVLSLVPSVAKAGVVLGNLGASGTDLTGINGNNNPIVPSSTGPSGIRALAQGFNTGASGFGSANSLLLNSVSTVFGNVNSTLDVTAKLYTSGTAGNPDSLLATSVATSVTGFSGATRYTFLFANEVLAASTQYWIVFDDAVQWFNVQNVDGNNIAPSKMNSVAPATNDFSYVGSRRLNGSSNWMPSGANFNSSTGAAISVNVVPEPSTYVMAGIGAGLVGLARLRRRVR